jgi:hypothetical protein
MQCHDDVITKRLLHEQDMQDLHARQTDKACVDGGGLANHVATSSALRLLNGVVIGLASGVAPGAVRLHL